MTIKWATVKWPRGKEARWPHWATTQVMPCGGQRFHKENIATAIGLLAKGPGQASFPAVLSFLGSRKSWLLKGLRRAPNMERVEKEGTQLAVAGPGGPHVSKLRACSPCNSPEPATGSSVQQGPGTRAHTLDSSAAPEPRWGPLATGQILPDHQRTLHGSAWQRGQDTGHC